MKRIFSKTFLLFLFGVLLLSVLFIIYTTGLPVQSIFYWLTFIYWLVLIIVLKLSSRFSLLISLILFAISAFAYIITIANPAEEIMRIAFIGLIIGLPQAFIEYLKDYNSKSSK